MAYENSHRDDGMLSVKKKTIAVTVCILVLALGIAAVFSMTVLKTVENRKADQILLLMGETGQKNLNSYFQSIEQSADMISSYVASDLNGLEEEKLQAHLNRAGSVFDRIVRHTEGVLTYYYRIDPSVSRKVKGFWRVNSADGIVDQEVTDLSRYDLEDTSNVVWFTVPKATGKAAWLPPYITENLWERVVSYNIPVYYGGKFVGVIGIEIEYSTMAKMVDHITLYDTGYAFLNDAEGKIVYHPHMDVTSMQEQPQVPNGLLSEDKFIHYTFEGVEKEAVWLTLSNGMRLNLTVPEKEIHADWYSWRVKLAMAFAVILLASAALSKIFIGRIK